MINYLIIPGLGGSGAKHWQTWFENTQPNFKRVEQKNWNEPDIDEWVHVIDTAIDNYERDSVVLVAHSLGCLTVSEWARQHNKKIKGAMLVAPPDINIVHNVLKTNLFDRSPVVKLDFPSVVVASTTDQWSSILNAQSYAQKWGSHFVDIGDAGHINADSGHCEWTKGLEILYSIK